MDMAEDAENHLDREGDKEVFVHAKETTGKSLIKQFGTGSPHGMCHVLRQDGK